MADTLFYCPDIVKNPRLPEQESQHCVKVLRMKEGDPLTVTDGEGFIYDCSLLEAHPKHCTIGIQHQSEEKKREYTLHTQCIYSHQSERFHLASSSKHPLDIL